MSLGLALALVFLISTSASADKMGAGLRILKKDGASVEGELIAAKVRVLVLMGSSGECIGVGFDDIGQIMIIRKSKALDGAGIGLLGGAIIGALIGYDITPAGKEDGFFHFPPNFGKGIAAMKGAGIGALAGVLLGAGVGARLSADEKFAVADMTPIMKDELLIKLRSEARFPDYQ